MPREDRTHLNLPARKAVRDRALQARITRRLPLVYGEGASQSDDRPPFVLAASGLTTLGEYLFVVQDNANWLAVVHPDDRVSAVPLPRGAGGARVFSKERRNTHQKVDLEACVVMHGPTGPELVAFGSGTSESSGWIVCVTGLERLVGGRNSPAETCRAKFLDANAFYQALRADRHFCGGRLNIEGAIGIENDRVLLLQRGNAPSGEGEPVDATAEVAWPLLRAHLQDHSIPPPALQNVTRFELGEIDGVRLTFSDAEYLGGGRILYSASAEDPDSGAVSGSVLGLIEPSGSAGWAEILCEDGSVFKSKIEGLSLVPGDGSRIRFVVDDDDESAPSQIFEVQLGGAFRLN